MLVKINGKKLKELRGNRSLGNIVEASGKAFSDVALLKWETGATQPREDNLRKLLKVYGCDLKDIAEPLALN